MVRSESAEAILDEMPGSGGGGAAIQHKEDELTGFWANLVSDGTRFKHGNMAELPWPAAFAIGDVRAPASGGEAPL